MRRRLIVCLVSFFLATVVCYFFSSPIIEFLIRPLRTHNHAQLFFQKPYEAFFTHIKVAGLAGFLVSLPVIFTQLWLFVTPALYQKEKKIVFPLILISVLLFLCGAFFAYAVVIPWGLYFLLSFQSESLQPLLTLTPYFSFLFGMLLSFGFLFDFPVVLIGLVHFGVLKTRTLAQARRVVIVLIFVLAAILTPSPDPISQLMMAVPLLVLFEISLLFGRFVEKKKNRPAAV